MDKIKQYFADVNNGITGQEIHSLIVPEGHTYNFKEVGPLVEVDTVVRVYIVDEMVCEFRGDINDVDPRRHVVNWNLTQGMELRIIADNASGAVQELGAGITYDDITG